MPSDLDPMGGLRFSEKDMLKQKARAESRSSSGRRQNFARKRFCLMSKTSPGNFFEDFRIGQVIRHTTPRTVTTGDGALYCGLFGPRFAPQSSDAFARAIGYPRSPIDDLLVFHVIFGKTVPDVSLNAVAIFGFANFVFLPRVYPGAPLNAVSEVIGLKENSSRKTGIVYVRST